ncbi:hypothetical protein Ais01nite_73560 [Asanoa ishikariensis]|nr:hypothetical protein Ais01nite_73560 [Asanoa ishikariensis]
MEEVAAIGVEEVVRECHGLGAAEGVCLGPVEGFSDVVDAFVVGDRGQDGVEVAELGAGQ